MKHPECKDCKLREGDCGHHFKMDGITDYDIPSQSACDQYDNCMFFQPKPKAKRNSERPQGEWIPVSERLPEDRNLVLVTAYWHETYQVMQASYFGEGEKNGWWCVPFNNCGEHMRNDLHVIAWQPLPKPYKKGGAE